eukprot:13045696-Ditylum_brightwellii.AAC.1
MQCKVDIHIDNKGIVKHINNQISYPHDYPYNTLSPDWDLIAQAAITLQQHGNSLSINHIKSHQDNETPEEKLNLSARLNIAADRKATQYQIQHGKVDVQVPRVEVNTVQ